MIAQTIRLLQADEYLGEALHIEIAKGKNQYVTNLSQAQRKVKRARSMKRKAKTYEKV